MAAESDAKAHSNPHLAPLQKPPGANRARLQLWVLLRFRLTLAGHVLDISWITRSPFRVPESVLRNCPIRHQANGADDAHFLACRRSAWRAVACLHLHTQAHAHPHYRRIAPNQLRLRNQLRKHCMESQCTAGQCEAKAQQNPQPQATPLGAWGRP